MKNKNKQKKPITNYIFAYTNFKRSGQTLISMAALESKRRISLSKIKGLLEKPKNEILDDISILVKNHYIEYKDGLPLWGSIICYQVHLFDETYQFDIDGNLIETDEMLPESMATMGI
jgi:hypothetical protein